MPGICPWGLGSDSHTLLGRAWARGLPEVLRSETSQFAFAAPNNEFLMVRSRGRISISEKKAASILALMLTLSRRERRVLR